MKLTTVALFAAGYVVGARAGRERYAQIVEGVASASKRLEQFSSRRPPGNQNHDAARADDGSRSQETPL